MKVVSMNDGTKIGYEVTGTKLSIGDGALTIDLSRYQKDYDVEKDIMVDREGDLAIGTGAFYVAQALIPAITYTETTTTNTDEESGETTESTERTANALDMDEVTLRLFSIDGIKIN
ncbi:MAG: hypothetical protein LUD12_10120 [Lachnospiraceae bacterium]|nr:hypothetical protein [Lachnospiraceae bacterium]